MAVLVVSAVVFCGFRSILALGREDVDAYESPLILSVARQLVAGPWELYGPFGGSNPLVLIHAPLYYRASGLVALPFRLTGAHPVDAARVAGRLVSALGLVLAAAASYRLGRLGGRSRRAGVWSALLVLSSPILAGQPFAVRPDMAGVALQTWGVFLVLRSLWENRGGARLASGLFGLAACVKQHFVGAWAASVLLVAVDRSRRRSGGQPASRLVLPGLLAGAAIYGLEWIATGGRIWDAAFVAAANVGRVHPGGWLHVGTVLAAMAGKGAGLAAVALAAAASNDRRVWAGFSSVLVTAVAGLSVVQLVWPTPLATGGLTVAVAAAAGVAAVGWSRAVLAAADDRRIDRAVGLYLVVEILILVALSWSSSGAWINYGIQGVVFASVLIGRSLDRAIGAEQGSRRGLAAVAVVAVLASVLMDAKVELGRRQAERIALGRLLAETGLSPAACVFADRPGLNRMSGRLEIVYDDWLYPAFESIRRAEPRTRWLRPMLASGSPVRAVVLESDSPHAFGLPEPLTAYDFRMAGRFGSFRVWSRGPQAMESP